MAKLSLGTLLVANVLAMVLVPKVAMADPLGDALYQRFGSEKANLENSKGLIAQGVHFDARMGIWFANLSGGLSSLVNSWDAIDGDDSAINKAARSIGTGSGLVREVGFTLQVKGNEAFFDYLSNQLFDTASDEVNKRVENPLARELIRRIAGEFRPDLRSLLGPSATTWLRAEFGKFRGEIENPTAFSSRNGVPWFPRKQEAWETDYFGFEIGAGYRTKNDSSGSIRSSEPTSQMLVGPYARYRRFTRPLAIGWGTKVADVHLQDGSVSAYEIGIKAEIAYCAWFCFVATGSMAPFTAYTYVDLGPLGWAGAVSVTMAADLRLVLPIRVAGSFVLSPYVGFRMESLLPIKLDGGRDADVIAGDTDAFNAPTLWTPDYFFWGPSVGLSVRM